jgi:hypothetical protein
MGEDVSALRRLEARRATVSDSVYSLDRMREATIKTRVPVGSQSDHIYFHEYFHGDNGAGIGASHQTGWMGLVAKLIEQSGRGM